MKKYFLTSFFITVCSFLFGQEYIVNGSFGFDKSEYQKNIRNSKLVDTLELPFIEDFSKSYPYQNQLLWLDDDVLVTNTACVNPPSIGAAVFDAINSDGDYYTTKYSTSHQADILTSCPINLYLPGDNSVYFSFFYQPKGITDAPETKDSLILQFYSPLTDKWENEWSATGSGFSEFQQVIIHIDNAKYLQKGFAFRFLNWASLPAATSPSEVGNCDQWYVDYIRLDKNRNSTDLEIPELAFQYQPKFYIDNYEMIPYEHYKYSPVKSAFNYSYSIKYRNNQNSTRTIDSLYLVFKEKQNKIENDTLFLGSYNVPANQNIKLSNSDIVFSFPNTNYNSLDYQIESVLITNSADSVYNNRVKIDKPLSNYYAYDDGTAEVSYGLRGDGTKQSTCATQFVTYKQDTLSGIRIYFNKAFKDEQPKYFSLMVWDNNDGFPGNVIYEKSGVEINKDYLYQFYTYNFDSVFSVADTFYIGWRNITDELINVGLDLNSTSNHKYFNIYGSWENSAITGDILMRPVFGNETQVTIKDIEKTNVKIYPNPANDYLKIIVDDYNISELNICIYDIYGRTVLIKTCENNSEIETSILSEGIYIVRISDNKKILSTEKIVIKH